MSQFSLWEQAWPTTIDEKYKLWRATTAGQTVYREATRRAYRLRGMGVSHYGIGAIAESIRFDHTIRVGRDVDGFKLNNNFRALLAREIMAEHPELEMFETRVRRAIGADEAA